MFVHFVVTALRNVQAEAAEASVVTTAAKRYAQSASEAYVCQHSHRWRRGWRLRPQLGSSSRKPSVTVAKSGKTWL